MRPWFIARGLTNFNADRVAGKFIFPRSNTQKGGHVRNCSPKTISSYWPRQGQRAFCCYRPSPVRQRTRSDPSFIIQYWHAKTVAATIVLAWLARLSPFRVTRSKQVDKEREVWLGETRENSFFPLTTIMKTENYYIYWRLLLGSAKLPLKVAILLQPSQGISGMTEREQNFLGQDNTVVLDLTNPCSSLWFIAW